MSHTRTEIGMHYAQQIQFCRHSQRNNGCKLTSNRRVQTDTGGYKKRHISLTQSTMVLRDSDGGDGVTRGDADFRKSPMKMIYRSYPKTASLSVTCHPIRTYGISLSW